MAISVYKIVVVGASAVGKTAVVQRLVEDTFSPDIQSTVGVEFKCYNCRCGTDSVKLNIWDTAGQERFRSVSKSYFRNAVGAILVYSVIDRASFDDMEEWMNDIHSLCALNAAILIVGNKSDLAHERVIPESEAQTYAQRHGVEYLETSAMAATNITETFVRLASSIHEKVKRGEIRGTFQSTGPPLLVGQLRESQPAQSYCC
jgi:small GTP-binding protein